MEPLAGPVDCSATCSCDAPFGCASASLRPLSRFCTQCDAFNWVFLARVDQKDAVSAQAGSTTSARLRRPHSHRQREEASEQRLAVSDLRRLLQEASGSAERGTAADVSALAAKCVLLGHDCLADHTSPIPPDIVHTALMSELIPANA